MTTRSTYEFELYRDAKAEFRWRLRAHNGRIVADGAEGYKRKAGARAAIDRIAAALAIGVLVVVDATGGKRGK